MVPEESRTLDLVELARRVEDAGNRGDLDEAMSFFAPDAVWDLSPMGIGIVEGRAAIRRYLEDWLRAYDYVTSESEEAHDLGSGVGFQVHTQPARPRGSSGEVHQRSARVVLTVDALIARVTSYTEIDEGRAAAQRLADDRASAMSDDSTAVDAVALLRRYSDAVVRRDFDEVERCVAPNVRFVTAASGTLEGRAAVRALIEDIVRPFETFEIDEGEEIRSLGNGVVLAVFFTKGRMAGGVGELRSPFASVSVVAHGVIEWHAHYTEPGEARAAAERLATERG